MYLSSHSKIPMLYIDLAVDFGNGCLLIYLPNPMQRGIFACTSTCTKHHGYAKNEPIEHKSGVCETFQMIR